MHLHLLLDVSSTSRATHHIWFYTFEDKEPLSIFSNPRASTHSARPEKEIRSGFYTSSYIIGNDLCCRSRLHCELLEDFAWFITFKASCLTHLPEPSAVPWREQWSLWSSCCWHWWWGSRSSPGCGKWPSVHMWSPLKESGRREDVIPITLQHERLYIKTKSILLHRET